jgi:stress-induced morphogen
MTSPEEIRQSIERALPGARVHVEDTTGAGDHFEVEVTASAFSGKTPVEQHQLIYRALDDLMPRIHALSIHTAAS